MALPKEPRQKMINMMYLVLTALLALNVSSEILNAFKTVNTTLKKSNDVLTQSTDKVFTAFDNLRKDPANAEKANIWYPKAKRAQELTNTLFGHIEQLKDSMMRGSGYDPEKGDTAYNESNLDVSTRIMDKNGGGPKLKSLLEQYKKDILAIDPKIGQEFATKIPINLDVPKSQTGTTANSDWTSAYFRMTPTIAAITILSKFQNDLKNTENQVTNYCLTQVGNVVYKFDKFEPLVGTNATYFMPGDEMEINAGLGAFNAEVKPTVTINGQSIPVNANGMANHKFKVNGTGTIKVRVAFKDPNTGENKVLEKDLPYTVGMPSGASVFLKKMNVMYVGVDNPMTISGGSVGREKVKVVFPGGTISNAGGDEWIAKPSTTGMSEIQVIADGKPYKFPMRLKLLPNPAGFVGRSKGGRISAADFKAQGGLLARLEDSEFEAGFRVVGYVLAASGGAFPNYQQANNEGNRWTGAAKAIVDKATPGTTIFFDQIRVVGPDGRNREITPMVFQLQ
ncbi:MAG TPA: gliding motility protein GldM [Chitinophagaceae bacterium]|nr:gliding motility protein GldM [Chitinophagaceae bacterium]